MALSLLTQNALYALRSLAVLPEKDEQLSEVRHELNRLVENLNALDDMRHSARGIVEIYEKVSILEALDIDVFYEPVFGGRPSREYFVEFSNAKVLPGRLDPDVALDVFTDLLKCVYTRDDDLLSQVRVPEIDSLEPSTVLFSDDLVCLHTAADSGDDMPHERRTIKTSRAQLVEAIESGGIDGVAQSLFPETWQRVALPLGLAEDGAYENAAQYAMRERSC